MDRVKDAVRLDHMILCGQCGSKVEEGKHFCAECGVQVRSVFRSEPAKPAKVNPDLIGGVAADQPDDAVESRSQTANDRLQLHAQNHLRTIVLITLAPLLFVGVIVILTSLKTIDDNQNRNTLRAAENQDTGLVAKQNNVQPTNRPSPQTIPDDSSSIRQEVANVLNGWAAATSNHDLDTHMSFYANELHTYYGRKNVSAFFVRSSRAPAFARYPELNVQLRNISVAPDPSGVRATAVFDKSYVFRGDKELSGSVQQMAWLQKIGNRWLITGEKDLQVYYVKK